MNYTTEIVVTKFCLKYVDPEGICNKRYRPHLFRPDYISHAKKLVVEFDGYQHYTNPTTILRDYRKDIVLVKDGYNVIHIPYFVQLNESVSANLFGEYVTGDPSGFVDYPHGFVDDKATLPSHFCTLGVERFINDLNRFSYIADDIWSSLDVRCKSAGDWRAVYPTSFNEKGGPQGPPFWSG